MNPSLAEAIFWIAALACIVAQIMLLRSSISAKGERRSELVPASPRVVELAWTVLPALVLCALLLATWRKIAEPDAHEHMDHSAPSAAAMGYASHHVTSRT